MIALETLGPVRVTVDRHPAPAELLWRKNLALLVYLARSPKGRRTRSHLVGLLWPEKEESAARHSLNEALRVIRRSAAEGLETDAEQAGLRADAVTLDVDLLEQRMAEKDWSGASALVLGEFLEGFAVPGNSEFESWLMVERREWRHRGVLALCARSEQLATEAQADEALAAAERALRLDAGSEPAIAQVMRVLALRGYRAEALARYDEFRAHQLERLGTEQATPALEELAQRIRGSRDRGAAAAPPPPADPLRRAPLVGRNVELARLIASWERCRHAAQPELALVASSEGGGRSRLLEEVAVRIALDGALVLRIRAVRADRGEPLGGLRALASAGLAEAPGTVAAAPDAIAALATALPRWAERFPAVRPATDPWSLPRAIAEVLRAVLAEQPVALIVDDAHCLDDASLDAFAALIRGLSSTPLWIGLSAVLPAEGDGIDGILRRLGRDVAGSVIPLEPLDGEAIARLVRWAFPRYDDVEVARLARRLETDSAGLPLLVVELLFAIASGMAPGALAWPAPLKTLDASLPGDFPPELIAAFRVGFRRLSGPAQAALAAAAVVGERVTGEEIGRVAELDGKGAASALDELEWSRWLAWEPRGYSFVARIARSIILGDLLTRGQRQRLEARAGQQPRL